MNDPLILKNQLCFPLYVASKEVIKRYKPLLDKLDLTYTQYITMMVLWEKESINVKSLGEILFLDSGTLTPLLKKLEQKNYITRQRDNKDERNLIIKITEEGYNLKKEATDVPKCIAACLNLSEEDSVLLYKLLYKLLGRME